MTEEPEQTGDDWTPRRLSHEAARAEQRESWAAKTMVERLAAGAALKERLLRMRGIDLNELQADWTVSRVRRDRS